MKNPPDMTDRELDTAIAVEVMVAKPSNIQGVYHIGTDCIVTGECVPRMPHRRFQPSHSMNSAWQVVERMRELGLDPLIRFEGDKCLCVCNASTDENDSVTTWHSDRVYSTGRRRVTVTANTAPRAICEAALTAVRNSTPTTKEQP